MSNINNNYTQITIPSVYRTQGNYTLSLPTSIIIPRLNKSIEDALLAQKPITQTNLNQSEVPLQIRTKYFNCDKYKAPPFQPSLSAIQEAQEEEFKE